MDDLPESLAHLILSNLLVDGTITKELARLSLISKGWQRACSSYEVVDFIGTCSYGTPRDVQKTQQFIKYLDKIMTNYRHSSENLRKLRLHIDFYIFSNSAKKILPDESYTKSLPPLLDKWINIALDKRVQDLDLRIRVRCIDRETQKAFGIKKYDSTYKDFESSNWRYYIPIRVLSSDFVKSLSLGWQVCLPRSLVDDINMDLPVTCLRSVEIFRVKEINSKALEKLIRACPNIEELIVDSEYIDEIRVFGLHRLKILSIRRCISNISNLSSRVSNFQIQIEAPSLETLCLFDLGRGREERKVYYTTTLAVDCCNLKCLKLIRDLSMDDDKLSGFVANFPVLESLEVDHCSLIQEMNINNPMMKKMELKFGNLWNGFRRVEISSPNVLHFRHECTSGKKLPSIWISENNCPRYVEIVFKNTQPIYLFSYWFRNLRESMLRLQSSQYTSLSFNYTWKKEHGEEKDLVPTHLPACKIHHLNLNITGPCSSFPVILSRLFSTLHPTTLQASLVDDNSGQGHAFLQFLCENLSNRGSNTTCSACSVHYKCWKHQLIEVKFEGIKGSDGKRSLNWFAMLKLLPTLTVDHQICFTLQWAT